MISDKDFLNWVADRFVHAHGESENVDFVRRLRKMAASSEFDPSVSESPITDYDYETEGLGGT